MNATDVSMDDPTVTELRNALKTYEKDKKNESSILELAKNLTKSGSDIPIEVLILFSKIAASFPNEKSLNESKAILSRYIEHLSKSSSLKVDPLKYTFDGLLRIYLKTGELDRAIHLVKGLEEHEVGCFPNTKELLLMNLLRNNNLDAALDLLKIIWERDHISSRMWGYTLNQAIENNNYEVIHWLFTTAKITNYIVPSNGSLKKLLILVSMQGDYKLFKYLSNIWVSKNNSYNKFIRSLYIECFASAKSFDQAIKRLCNGFPYQGARITVDDLPQLTSLIASNSKYTEKALAYLPAYSEISDNNENKTLLLNVIIEGMSQSGYRDLLPSLLNRAIALDISPNQDTVLIFMKMAARSGDMGFLKDSYSKCFSHNIIPTKPMFELLILSLIESEEYGEAFKYADEMRKQGLEFRDFLLEALKEASAQLESQ
ncbi:hypothetical protein NADFUDRAFT_40532 [Nadsonia fulvescens var. elongata DSM 6958]|uniref:Pentacotripeptide-repeat region of PRORP domain-containing protein n=1 Tax=Nadsonia fulvescens var. elongata DSM 6958 TaxID=857566 RepID=A0A1E3PPK6_9ASCO|nr:hypothetical protein NADFUDRAFT_40532 [Nadsonia fulvescens var. elongata DSM 6958]